MESQPPRKKRVLVVDDHVSMTQLVKALLERSGSYVVKEENQNWAVIETIHHFVPDLVLLDLHMPGLVGNEIAAYIKDDPKLRYTAVVFMTSLVNRLDKHGMLDGYPCLTKPIVREEMVRVIDENIARVRTGWMKMHAVALPG